MTRSIEEIDSNFKTLEIQGVPLVFRPADASPFDLGGLPWFSAEKKYCRLPQAALQRANDGVKSLAWHTAGAMLRFKSDSTSIGLRAKLTSGGDMNHMPRSGSGGFDLFEGSGSSKVFRANLRHEHGSNEIGGLFARNLPRKMREWTIYLPLYNGVEEMFVGLDPESEALPPGRFAHEKPVLFYGSSITQGGCASRPGNAYAAIITRRMNAGMINWGFSGSARGEQVMAETIATLDLGVFVCDYDHNAPSPEHLAETHAPFFKTIRAARPRLPVVFVSRPGPCNVDICRKCREIILATFEAARAAGDKNVYFVDGAGLFGKSETDMCTVDGCHPNDVGFLRMADAIMPAVQAALGAV
jgi:hypothetical protein